MARHYGNAERLAREANADNLFYPAKNGISAELRLAFLERRPAELAVDRMRAVQESLARASSERPDFWSVVGQIELRVLVAVAAQRLAGESAALIAEFSDLKARVPARTMWDSVHSEARFTLEPYLGIASAAEKRAAARCSTRCEMAARSAPAGGRSLRSAALRRDGRRPRQRASASAGDFDDRAGGVARPLGEQPDDRLADFVGGAGALHRQLRRDLADAVGRAAGGVDLGVDDAGPDRVDADAFAGELLGEADREGLDAALGGGVVDVLARAAELGRRRRDVDDRAAGVRAGRRPRRPWSSCAGSPRARSRSCRRR